MDEKIVVPTKYGNLEITTPYNITLRLPEWNVTFNESLDTVAKIANGLIAGTASQECVKLLAEIAKMRCTYHVELLEMLERDVTAAAKSVEAVRQLEEQGYQYFPKKNQLLVKSTDELRQRFLVVEFLDSRRAKCGTIRESNMITPNLRNWLSAGEIKAPIAKYIIVTPEQAEILKKAICELQLPYGDVGEIVWLISHYSTRSKQEQLFEKLETGFSDQELSDLTEKVRDKIADAERQRKYEDAGKFEEPIFFEDTKELMLADCYVLIDLSTDPPAMRIPYSVLWDRPSPAEVGRYVLKRKWDKDRYITGMSNEDFVAEFGVGVLGQVERAIPRIPEPYRTRLSNLYAELLARALKNKR